MKKIIIVLFIFLILCSCGKKEEDKYANFEHYKLENFNKYVSYDFVSSGYNEKDTYIVADITPENYELNKEGIFYKISDNDYILLKIFESVGIEKYNTINTYFYQDTKNNKNNIYLLRNIGSMPIGFTVNKEKITYQNLHFDTSKIREIVEKESNYVSALYCIFYSIEKVTPEFIYLEIRLEDLHKNILVKCSFDNSVCEEV